uniref:Uncharacterized protein n=1 Tax=Arundo donax TaxID=35708 RepID=A0A0A9A0Y6_ARUDO
MPMHPPSIARRHKTSSSDPGRARRGDGGEGRGWHGECRRKQVGNEAVSVRERIHKYFRVTLLIIS